MNSIITLISDYGEGSPYTASIIGKALTVLPGSRVIEISGKIAPFDINQAAFVLGQVYPDFPPGTWHIIAIDSSVALHRQYLVAEFNGHFFISADNGIFSLLFENEPATILKINPDLYQENELFAEKNVFLNVISGYYATQSFNGIASPAVVQNFKQSIKPVVESGVIKGVVLYIDGYNNAITNISGQLFNELFGNKSFRLYYWGRHSINRLSKNYHDGGKGDDLLLINEKGYLEIAINKGKGAQLLGLRTGSRIIIEPDEPEPL